MRKKIGIILVLLWPLALLAQAPITLTKLSGPLQWNSTDPHPYESVYAVQGGTPPYNCSLFSGALPPGFTVVTINQGLGNSYCVILGPTAKTPYAPIGIKALLAWHGGKR
jgi:hypothetical protein